MSPSAHKSQVLTALAHHAATDMLRVALRSGGKDITYFDLLQAVNELAAQLVEKRPHCVGLEIENGIAWCIADLALVMAEIPSIPLPPFFSAAQREHALASAGANLILTNTAQWQFTRLDYSPVPLPEGTTKITFTSGTTGTPKGVCLSQPGMEQVAESLIKVIEKENAARHLAVLPLSVLLENIGGLYATLLAGGTYVVEPLVRLGFTGLQPNGAELLQHMAAENITSCILVPEYAAALLQAQQKMPVALPQMKFMAVGGARVHSGLLEKAETLELPFYQGYGLSEAASVVAVNTPSNNKPASAGKILPHVRYRIAEDGELILKNLAWLGYVGESAQQGEYTTGDIVSLDGDGYLTIQGRKRNVIILANGRNISPEWPESELLAQPEIAQVLVFGEAAEHLSAFIVPASFNADITYAVDQVNARLPEYACIQQWQKVPAFTAADGFLTPNGRLKRSEILAYYNLFTSENFHGKEAHHAFL